MKYLATIEIPKGSDRRIHMTFDKSGFKDFGPIKEQIPVNDGVMPVHYGYIDKTINRDEGDNVDVLIFSTKSYQTGDQTEIEIIGMLTRKDGDHKVIAIDDSVTLSSFAEVAAEERDLILKYFGHKSEILSIDDKVRALAYVESCLEK